MTKCDCPLCNEDRHRKVTEAAQELLNKVTAEDDTQVLAYGFIAAAAALTKQAGADKGDFVFMALQTYQSVENGNAGSIH